MTERSYSNPQQPALRAVRSAADDLIDTGWHAGLVRQAVREVQRQINSREDHVDTTAVPPHWVNESPAQHTLQTLLDNAGFVRENYRFCWQNGSLTSQ